MALSVLLIAGSFHNVLFNSSNNIVNQNPICLEEAVLFLEQTHIQFDNIIITDDGMGCDTYLMNNHLNSLTSFLARQGNNIRITIITNYNLNEKLQCHNCKIIFMPYVRIPMIKYFEIINKSEQGVKQIDTKNTIGIPKNEPKKQFFSRFKQMEKEEVALTRTDQITKDFENISRGISRVVAITGHRGSGITSTVANLAEVAGKKGLSTIVVDLDIENRSMNLYFGGFNDMSEKDDEISASLIRSLAKPQEYRLTAYNARNSLYLTTLSYKFNDKKLIEQFFTPQKLIGMISVFRQKFNLCIIDLPLEILSEFKEILIHIDSFGMCVSNNLYSVLTTLRNSQNILDRESLGFLNAKSKIIVSKYNDRAVFSNEVFSPQKVCEMLNSDLSDFFKMEFALAGHIPLLDEFDSQIETDMPIVNTNAEMEKLYGNILLRILEGVK